MAPEYLFIRILEACNADCFMCGFRLSKDRYRFTSQEMKKLLPRVRSEGIRYIRLTGGEPLLHREIVNFIELISEHSLQSSIITNGYLLGRKLEALAKAGLNQIIVSIDGAYAATHNHIRGTPGLFDRAFAGLRGALHRGLLCRVNTVVGPDNFREMPALQDLLTELGVHQWELSSLKLERPLAYSARDRAAVESVVQYVYCDAVEAGRLIPMGKIWCGETDEERQRYFTTGVTPRADRVCLLVDKVRYLDAKDGRLYACSLLPHRPGALAYAAAALPPERFSVLEPNIERQAEYFKGFGPTGCTGCSTTAAGYSNQLLAGMPLGPWSF